MAKGAEHVDGDTDDASDRIYDAVWSCRKDGISEAKILMALTGEISGVFKRIQEQGGLEAAQDTP